MGTLLTGCGGKTPAPVEPDATIESTESNISSENVNLYLNLTDYVEFSQNGSAEGQASVRAYLKTEDIIDKLRKHTIGWYDDQTLERTLYGKDNHHIELVTIRSENSIDEYNNDVYYLKNGDVVQYNITVNERGLRLLREQVPGVEFNWDNIVEYHVSGLESAVIEINPFNDEHCEFWGYFNGTSGNAELDEFNVVLYDRSSNGGSVYTIDSELDLMGHEGNWKNGDQVKVIITESDEELTKIGYKLTQREGIITIDWLPEN